MNILDVLPYHETKICVIFSHGGLRIFDYAAATQNQITSCEKIAVADDGESVTLNGSAEFSAYQLYARGKIERRELPLGYAKKDGEIIADPIEAPIVKRIFDLYLLDKFCRPSGRMEQEPPIISEETWAECSRIAQGGVPAEESMTPKI